MTRFSKATLAAELQARVDGIQTIYGFDSRAGTAQIPYIAKSLRLDATEVSKAYGAYYTLLSLAQEYGLDVCSVSFPWRVIQIGDGYIRYEEKEES